MLRVIGFFACVSVSRRSWATGMGKSTRPLTMRCPKDRAMNDDRLKVYNFYDVGYTLYGGGWDVDYVMMLAVENDYLQFFF